MRAAAIQALLGASLRLVSTSRSCLSQPRVPSPAASACPRHSGGMTRYPSSAVLVIVSSFSPSPQSPFVVPLCMLEFWQFPLFLIGVGGNTTSPCTVVIYDHLLLGRALSRVISKVKGRAARALNHCFNVKLLEFVFNITRISTIVIQ